MRPSWCAPATNISAHNEVILVGDGSPQAALDPAISRAAYGHGTTKFGCRSHQCQRE